MWAAIAKLLDDHTALYLGPGCAFLFLSSYLAIRALLLPSSEVMPRAGRAETLGFTVVVALCLLAFRWPSFLYLIELNPDESQLITNARKFLVAPIPWLHVDTTTSGPLNSWVLLIPVLFDLPIHYPSVRITGAVLLLCVLIFSYLTLRTLCGEWVGRLAILPSLALLGIAQSLFLDFTTEMLSIALLAGSTYLLAAVARGHAYPLRTYLAGLCLGAIPFAKLQSGPLALLVFSLAFVGLAPRADPPERGRRIIRAWLIAGGATVPLALLAVVLSGNALSDAWRSYILTNLFTASSPLSPSDFLSFLLKDRPFVAYVFTTLLAIVAVVGMAWWFRGRPASRENDAWILATAAYGVLGLYVIWQAARPWSHYLLFLIHPLILMTGLLWHRAVGTDVSLPARLRSRTIAIAASVLFVAWAVVFLRAWGPVQGKIVRSIQESVDPVSRLILTVSGQDRHVTIWGYAPHYYVKTGLYPSTRDVMTQFQIQTTPHKPYYIGRYLADFRAAQPNVFIDATGKGNPDVFWDADPSPAAVSELDRILRDDFILVHDIVRCGKIPATRIFVRKKRWEELRASGIAPVKKELCLY